MLLIDGKMAHQLRSKTNVPKIHKLDQNKQINGKKYNIMVMDLFGKDVYEIFNEFGKSFDLSMVLHLGK